MSKWTNKQQTQTKANPFSLTRMHIPKQEISFAVTEDCNLNCSYCYLPRKNSGKKMTFEIAKKAIDYFLASTDYFNVPRAIIDFIGGEPLLEIDLIDRITDYFKTEAYRLNHPWFSDYKILISTNGILYHTAKVQEYVEKNKNCLSPSISLDGIQEKHDNARKYADGKGSYDDVVKNARLMLEQFPYSTLKATFGKGDIGYYKDSILHFIELGYPLRSIFANVVYEDFCGENDDLLFEQQLIELADYLIDNNMCCAHDYLSIFSRHIGQPYTAEHLSKHWCNVGHGVLVGADGSFYPCIRFLEMASMDNLSTRKIGNVDNGIDFDKLRPFRILTLKNCSPRQCLECKVASGCGMCSGHALGESSVPTIFSRPVHICKMHKARVRANEYFWKKLAHKENTWGHDDSYSRTLQIPNKKVLNVLISSDCPGLCGYETGKATADDKELLPPDIFKKYLAIAGEANYYVNLVYANDAVNEIYRTIAGENCYQVTRPYKNENTAFKIHDRTVFIFKTSQEITRGFSCLNVILHLNRETLNLLADYTETLFSSHQVKRINLVIDDLNSWEDADIDRYEEQLNRLSRLIYDYYREKRGVNFSALTDRLYLDKMNNCMAGLTHLTLGPDGKLYLCPAFYYKNQPLEAGPHLQINPGLADILKLENAPICLHCDAFQCHRCYARNREQTNEFNVPGEKQCVIAHIEREAGRLLQELLVEANLIPFPNLKRIPPLNYMDPFEVSKIW